jgi:hypothetical protein
MSQLDPAFYSNITRPSSRTRSAVAPIHSFPLEKRRITRNTLLDPWRHIYNIQGLSASNFSDADADAGKFYYIHVDSYDSSPITTNIIDEVSPLLVNPAEFEPGAYYTYMIVSIVGKDPVTNNTVVLSQTQAPELYATRTTNMYEFGTKHHQIMYRKAIQDEALFAELAKTYKNVEYRIYAAGEIMCVTDNKLVFNFISGTYKMKKHITARRVKYEQAYFTYMMSNIAPKYTTILFQQPALIIEDVLPLTRRELSRLRRHNIPLFLFDTEHKCYRMRNAVIQLRTSNKSIILTNEDLEEIYIRIRDQQL